MAGTSVCFLTFVAFFEDDRTEVSFKGSLSFFPISMGMNNGKVSQTTIFRDPIEGVNGMSILAGFVTVFNGETILSCEIEESSFRPLGLTVQEADERFSIPFDTARSVRFLDKESDPQ